MPGMVHRHPSLACLLLGILVGCTSPSRPEMPDAPGEGGVPVTADRLTGRWILAPGDCRMPPSEAHE